MVVSPHSHHQRLSKEPIVPLLGCYKKGPQQPPRLCQRRPTRELRLSFPLASKEVITSISTSTYGVKEDHMGILAFNFHQKVANKPQANIKRK